MTRSLLRRRACALLLGGLLTALARLAAAQAAGHEALLKDLPWRGIGPAIVGGRIDDIAVVESRPTTVYLATASGGLFKTVNNGTTWESLFDTQATSSIGDVTLAPSNPQVVWVGTGEANNRQSSSWGDGVYRSTDGGKSWSNLGLEGTMHIGRIAVHPRNPDIAYVAAVGRLWGPSPERGLYRTLDGGKSWNRSLFINDDTGCTDVAMDPLNPDILYAAAYQRRRTAFGFNGGGPAGGIYRTTDGGVTWTKLSRGLPTGDTGRIGLSIYRKDPRIVYATVENARGGVFRSENRGESWQRVSGTNPRPMYYSQIVVDPNDDRRIWVMGASMYLSTDGGRSFGTNVVTRIHGDYHAMWINPADSDHMLVGSDGGIHWSYDRGRTWDFVNTLSLAQFYEVAFDMRRPYWVYGGLQDNGTWAGPSATLTVQGPSNDEWVRVGGGDGFYVQVDPTDHTTIYLESQNGAVVRLNQATGERKSIRPRPLPGEAPYRFDWNTPILLSPHNPRKVLVGGNRLFISTDRGDSWRRTEDLSTAPDRSKLAIMGAMPPGSLSRDDGQESFGQITTVSESPLQDGVLWVGTDDGNLQLSHDDGVTWRNLASNLPGVPPGTYVSRVTASHHARERAYVALDGHRSDDFRPYLFVTDDFGESWAPLSGGIPEGSTISVVREHPRNPDLLFLGTERGAYVSLDQGRQWHRFPAPLPVVPVDDIQIHPRDNDLILATHGRGIWILDNLAVFEALAGRPMPAAPVLFAPRSEISWRTTFHKGSTGHRVFLGPNPRPGAAIHYYLPSRVAEGVSASLSILERDGRTLVRSLLMERGAGLHRATWDLRRPAPPNPLATGGSGGGGGGGGQGGGFGLGSGPRALPGVYLVRLKVGDREETLPLRFDDDPRIRASVAERRAQAEALERVAGYLRSLVDARDRLQALRAEALKVREGEGFSGAAQEVRQAVTSLIEKIEALQAKIRARAPVDPEGAGPRPPVRPLGTRALRLYSAIDAVTEAPGRAVRQEMAELAAELREFIREVNEVNARDVTEVNGRIRAAGLGEIKPGESLIPPNK